MEKVRVFKINTENKDIEWIKNLLAISVPGASVQYPEGLWNGVWEKALEITLYINDEPLARAISERIKHHNKQEAIYLVEIDAKCELI